MKKRFTGAGVALLTPFREDLSIDYTALGRIVDDLIANSIDFLVVLGTTAETATLSSEEKQAIINKTIFFICFNFGLSNIKQIIGLL